MTGPPDDARRSEGHPAARLAGRLLARHPRAALLATGGSLVAAADVGLRPLLVGSLTGQVTGGDRSQALTLTAVLVAAALAGAAADYLRSMATARLAEGSLADLRVAVLDLELGAAADDERPTLGNAVNDTSLASQHLAAAAPEVLGAALTLLATTVALAVVQPVVAAATLLAATVVLVPLTRWYRRRAVPALARFFRSYDEMTESLRETAAGAPVAWRFGRPDRAARFDLPNETEGRAYEEICRLASRYTPSVALLRGVVLAVALVATVALVDGPRRVDVVAAYLVGVPTLLGAIEQVTWLVDGLTLGLAAFGRLAALDLPLDPAGPEPPPAAGASGAGPSGTTAQSGARLHAGAVLQAVGLERVFPTFTLGPVDLALGPGVTAVVGATGAGKSTLARLLAGLDLPTAGGVLVGGQDPRAAREAGALVLLPQDPHLFPGTVLENLRLARPSAGRADVEAVLAAAGLDRWPATLPAGLDSPVDEVGDGERRLVGLLRVLLKDPAVLVLDEPTTGLDAMTGRRVERASAEAFRDRTVVLVTHNLASARQADRIVVLDRGRLVDHGSHDDLWDRCPRYRELSGA